MIDNQRVVQVWQQGYNFRDVGKQLGVTGERVRQVVLDNHNKTCTRPWVRPTSSSGPHCECVEIHRRARTAAQRQKLNDPRIQEAYKAGMPVNDIARQYQISARSLWEEFRKLPEDTKAIRKTNMWKANCKRTDQAELIRHIQAVANKLGRTPTRSEYDANVESGPSSQTVCIRFGYWSKALQAAGLAPSSTRSFKASRPRSDRHWTEDRINDALHYLYDDIGELPSIGKYRSLSSQTAWLPSDQIVRRNVRWPEVRLRIMNEHSAWTPKYSKLDLVDPYKRGGRKRKAAAPVTPVVTTPVAPVNQPNVWANQGEWHGSIRST